MDAQTSDHHHGPTIRVEDDTLVRGNGRNILVDSGFYRPQFFKEWKVNDFIKPSDAIAKLGLKPE